MKQTEEGYAPAKKGPKRTARWVEICNLIQQYLTEHDKEDALLIKEADSKAKSQFVFSTSYRELRDNNKEYVFSLRTSENKKGFWIYWRRK